MYDTTSQQKKAHSVNAFCGRPLSIAARHFGSIFSFSSASNHRNPCTDSIEREHVRRNSYSCGRRPAQEWQAVARTEKGLPAYLWPDELCEKSCARVAGRRGEEGRERDEGRKGAGATGGCLPQTHKVYVRELTFHLQRRIQAIKDKRAAKEEKERYAKMAEKMHKKRVERLKRREKRNKLLKS